MWDKAELARLRERAKHIRLIATDLDGTLLAAPSVFTPRTARAVKLVQDRGVAFTVCTGRSFYELGDMPQRLGLTAPVICRNGAEIVDPGSGRTLFRRLIPERESIAFISYCLREGIDMCLTTQDATYLPHGSAFVGAFGDPERAGGMKAFWLEEDTPLEGLAHYKIILVKKQPKYGLARAFIDRLPGIRAIGAAEEIDDLVAAAVSKGDGLRWLAERLGTDGDGCCAFGDYANDISMLEYAGLSFAMENAGEDVKAAAKLTAPSNRDDGVAQVLEALFGE